MNTPTTPDIIIVLTYLGLAGACVSIGFFFCATLVAHRIRTAQAKGYERGRREAEDLFAAREQQAREDDRPTMPTA